MGYCLKPFRESAANHYCRLFAPSRLPADQDRYREALMALGSAMIDDGSRVSDDRPEILVDCGYTYFGQFVAHDLTKDVSSVDEAWRKEPEELENLQTPKLDLGVLYGDGPESSGELYEEDRVRLKVGLSRAWWKVLRHLRWRRWRESFSRRSRRGKLDSAADDGSLCPAPQFCGGAIPG